MDQKNKKREREEEKFEEVYEQVKRLSKEDQRALAYTVLKRFTEKVNDLDITDRFKRWLMRGKKQYADKKELLKAWQIWNLLRKNAFSATLCWKEDQNAEQDPRIINFDINHREKGFEFSWNDRGKGDPGTLPKDDYFDAVLDGTNPDFVWVCKPNDEGEYVSFNELFEGYSVEDVTASIWWHGICCQDP